MNAPVGRRASPARSSSGRRGTPDERLAHRLLHTRRHPPDVVTVTLGTLAARRTDLVTVTLGTLVGAQEVPKDSPRNKSGSLCSFP